MVNFIIEVYACLERSDSIMAVREEEEGKRVERKGEIKWIE